MYRIKNTEGNENITRPGRRVSMQSSHRNQFTTTDMKRKRLFIQYNETTTVMRTECRKDGYKP